MRFLYYSFILFEFFFTSIFSETTKFKTVEDGILRIHKSSLQTGKFKLISQETGDVIYLIGVIHIGEKDYYEKIKTYTKDFDLLFYEGIPLPSKRSTSLKFNPLLAISQAEKPSGLKEITNYQKFVARQIHLSLQNEELIPDFNWINADASYKQFIKILKRYNIPEDKLTEYLTLDNKNTFQDYIDIKEMEESDPLYQKKILAYKKKVALNMVNSANELCFGDKMMPARQVLILERSKIVMNFVKNKFKSNNPQVFGMLYGAAHIPDFLTILQNDFGFTIESHEWLTAWDLN